MGERRRKAWSSVRRVWGTRCSLEVGGSVPCCPWRKSLECDAGVGRRRRPAHPFRAPSPQGQTRIPWGSERRGRPGSRHWGAAVSRARWEERWSSYLEGSPGGSSTEGVELMKRATGARKARGWMVRAWEEKARRDTVARMVQNMAEEGDGRRELRRKKRLLWSAPILSPNSLQARYVISLFGKKIGRAHV